MSPNEPKSFPAAPSHHQLRHHLREALTVISGRSQLLHRQLLRSKGLSAQERDALLRSLTLVTMEVQHLAKEVDTLFNDRTQSSHLKRRRLMS